jgi:peptidoglycan hydrolase-like protein with peptidoglycan-binding domain
MTATAAMAISRFEQLLKTSEQPPGSNHVPGISNFLFTHNGSRTGDSPWCAEAVSRVLSDVGQLDFYGHQFVNGIAYVPYITALARATGRMIPPTGGAPGDVCIFVFGGRHSNINGDHTGMVVLRNNDGTYHTIEGNARGRDSIGDEVAFHDRRLSELLGFYRPAYGAPQPIRAERPTPVVPPLPAGVPAYPGATVHLTSPLFRSATAKTWQTQMAKRGRTIEVDGIYGPDSEAICREFQTAHQLTIDGIVGPVTWLATFQAG